MLNSTDYSSEKVANLLNKSVEVGQTKKKLLCKNFIDFSFLL